MKEIRFHGRGGQGIVIGAQMLAYAFVLEGKYASSIPTFGPERRGAPVAAFLRFDEKPIRETHQIYEPDCVVALDTFQVKSPLTFDGIKGDGIAIFNTPGQSFEKKWHQNLKMLGLVDATSIALEEIGRPIANTCMMGAIARVTGWVSLDAVLSSLDMYFGGKQLETNARSARGGYESVKLVRKGR